MMLRGRFLCKTSEKKFTLAFFRSSIQMKQKYVEIVPALGESITEGTVSKWLKSPGDKVAVGDAVVVIETDKVTVDIKSSFQGYFLRALAEDNVSVGNPIFEIDSESSNSQRRSEISDTSTQIFSNAQKSTPVLTKPSHGERVPLIKFIGKRAHVPKPHPPAPEITSSMQTEAIKPPSAPLKVVKIGNGVDFRTLKGGAWFGRPKLSQKEIDAIESGGAI